MLDVETAVSHVLEGYCSAVAAKDAASFLSLYDQDARIFDCWENWSYENSAAWGVAVHGWFDALGTESVRVSFEDIRSSVTQELSIMSAVVTYGAVSAQGEPLQSMQNRITWGLRSAMDRILIVHEHTSAPIRFDGMKAVLTR